MVVVAESLGLLNSGKSAHRKKATPTREREKFPSSGIETTRPVRNGMMRSPKWRNALRNA